MASAEPLTISDLLGWDDRALRLIVDALIERLKEGLPGELRKIVENVQEDAFDQLALHALADQCEERKLMGAAAAWRKLSLKTGDILVVRAVGWLSKQGRNNLREAIRPTEAWLKEQGIEVGVLIVDDGVDISLLRIKTPEDKPG
jgi:hypothetical protein